MRTTPSRLHSRGLSSGNGQYAEKRVEVPRATVAAPNSRPPGMREKNGFRVRAAKTVRKSESEIFMYIIVWTSAEPRVQGSLARAGTIARGSVATHGCS